MSGLDESTAGRRLPVAPFLDVLARRRGLILLITIGAAVCAALFSLIAPVTYESRLSILPPDSSSPLSLGRANLQASLASLQAGFATANTSALYADMLRSRSVRRYAIDKLGLIREYGIDPADSMQAYSFALDRLEGDMDVRHSTNGLIRLTTLAHTGFFPGSAEKQRARHLSAAIGNTLAEGLDIINQQKSTNQARQARIYLEDQVAQTSKTLEQAGRNLADYQRDHLAVSLDDQMRVSIETAGTLEGELLAKEVARGVALQTMRPVNPVVQRLESEIGALRSQLGELRSGGPALGSREDGDTLRLGLEQLPEIGRRYALLLRDVKIQETVYELLTEQLYQARIQETQTLPVIEVLDEASVPIAKKSPVVRKVALLAAILGFVSSVFLAHALEWWSAYPWAQADAAVLRKLWKRS